MRCMLVKLSFNDWEIILKHPCMENNVIVFNKKKQAITECNDQHLFTEKRYDINRIKEGIYDPKI